MKEKQILVFSHLGIKRKKDYFDKVMCGFWCLSNLIDTKKSIKSIKVVSHPWSKPHKLKTDHKEINEIVNKIFLQLYKKLNQIHHERLSERSWKIMLLPWLKCFYTIIFERKLLIDEAIKNNNISEILLLDKTHETPPKNTREFTLSASQDVEWHEAFTKNIVEILYPNLFIKTFKKKSELNKNKNKIMVNIKELIVYVYGFFLRKQKYVFHITGTRFFNHLNIYLKLVSFPYLFLPKKFKVKQHDNFKLRNNLNIDLSNKILKSLINKMLSKYLPRSFLEDYEYYKLKADSFFPKNPKKIITYTGYYNDDLFKIYVANSLKNTSYEVFQHGGGFGVLPVHDEEKMIEETADTFHTWGWEKHKQKKKLRYSPIGSFHLKNIFIKSSKNKLNIVCPLTEWSLLNFKMLSGYNSYGQLFYLETIMNGVKMFPSEILNHFKFRLQNSTKGWNIKKRLIQNDLEKNILETKGNFRNDLKFAKFCFITTNSSTLMEALYSDIPTVVYLDPNYFPIREDAKLFYKELYDAEILFYNINLAIGKIISVYENPNLWWYKKNVSLAKDKFITNFAKSASDYY